MDTVAFKTTIKDLLMSLPVCHPNSSRTQYTVRCPYCGDSSTSNHAHFSVKIDTNSDDPLLYRCFRCNASGIVSMDTMEDLGLYIGGELSDEFRKYRSNIINSKYFSGLPEKYEIPDYQKNEIALSSLYYLNSRLESEFTLQAAKSLMLILDFKQFREENHISSIPHIRQTMLDLLDTRYIGFLSSNRNHITFRYMGNDDKHYRYFKVILNPNNVTTNTFYSPVQRFNLLYTGDAYIHIAEGTFDIISIMYNLSHNEKGLHLFYASCGFNYNSILRYLIGNGITTNIHLELYGDSDKSNSDIMNSISKKLRLWVDHIRIHRNQFDGEKDFGVPIHRIQEAIMTI